MKILLYALPRSGSKLFQYNFQKYMYANLKEETAHCYHATNYRDHLLSLDDNKIRTVKTSEQLELSEIIDRDIEILKRSSESFIYKIHYIKGFGDSELSCLPIFDRTYILKRRDLFSQIISRAVCNVTGEWHPGSAQEQSIRYLGRGSISFNEDRWRKIISSFIQLSELSIPGIPTLYCEDMFQLKTGKEFSEFVDIEHNDDYDLFNDNSLVELSERKFACIDRIESVREIFDEEIAKHRH